VFCIFNEYGYKDLNVPVCLIILLPASLASLYHLFNRFTERRKAAEFPDNDEDFELQLRMLVDKRKAKVEKGRDTSKIDRRANKFFEKYE
jgi:hypothetical protein